MAAHTWVRRILAVAIGCTATVVVLTGAFGEPVRAAGEMNIRGAATSSVLAPALRLAPPALTVTAGPVPAAAPAITNASTCHTGRSGSSAVMTIPSISYACDVYEGGQTQIDSGEVTWVTDVAANTVLAKDVGGKGTLWLASHRVSHGGAFAAVPTLVDGAIVTITNATTSASYRIVGRVYVAVRNGLVVDASGNPTNAATLDALLRPDRGADHSPRIVLQTCDGENFRWMIYGDLVTS